MTLSHKSAQKENSKDYQAQYHDYHNIHEVLQDIMVLDEELE